MLHRDHPIIESGVRKKDGSLQDFASYNESRRVTLGNDEATSRLFARKKIEISEEDKTQEYMRPPVQVHDVFSPVISSNVMRYCQYATSNSITIDEFSHPDLYFPASSIPNRKIAITYESNNVNKARTLGQKLFLSGRFNRVMSGNSEVAESVFFTESRIFVEHVPREFEYKDYLIEINSAGSFLINIPFRNVAFFWGHYENQTVSNFADDSGQAKSDHPVPLDNNKDGVADFDASAYLTESAGKMMIISMRRKWTTRTTVTQTLGPLLIGTQERQKTLSLTTSASVVTSACRIF